MPRYAILCGSAPRGFTQKKINEMYDFLTSSSGGAWAEKAEQILLYICTLTPVADEDKSVWLGGYEVRRSLIETFCSDGRGQVIYDCGRELERNEEIGLEKKVLENKITSLSFAREGE